MKTLLGYLSLNTGWTCYKNTPLNRPLNQANQKDSKQPEQIVPNNPVSLTQAIQSLSDHFGHISSSLAQKQQTETHAKHLQNVEKTQQTLANSLDYLKKRLEECNQPHPTTHHAIHLESMKHDLEMFCKNLIDAHCTKFFDAHTKQPTAHPHGHLKNEECNQPHPTTHHATHLESMKHDLEMFCKNLIDAHCTKFFDAHTKQPTAHPHGHLKNEECNQPHPTTHHATHLESMKHDLEMFCKNLIDAHCTKFFDAHTKQPTAHPHGHLKNEDQIVYCNDSRQICADAFNVETYQDIPEAYTITVSEEALRPINNPWDTRVLHNASSCQYTTYTVMENPTTQEVCEDFNFESKEPCKKLSDACHDLDMENPTTQEVCEDFNFESKEPCKKLSDACHDLDMENPTTQEVCEDFNFESKEPCKKLSDACHDLDTDTLACKTQAIQQEIMALDEAIQYYHQTWMKQHEDLKQEMLNLSGQKSSNPDNTNFVDLLIQDIYNDDTDQSQFQNLCRSAVQKSIEHLQNPLKEDLFSQPIQEIWISIQALEGENQQIFTMPCVQALIDQLDKLSEKDKKNMEQRFAIWSQFYA